MKRILYPCAVVFALLLLGRGPSPLQAQEGEPVSITLLPQAVSDDALVLLDQIAQINGGPDKLRHRIAKLDISEFKLGAAHVAINQEQVRFRLLLAGIDASRFRLLGARRTVIVASDEPITRRTILAAAEHKLREKYLGDAANVTITPAGSVVVPAVTTKPGDQIRLEAKVKAAAAYVGPVRVDVAVMVNGKTREVVPVVLEITVPEESAQDPVRTGQGVRQAHALVPASSAGEILVKARDSVRIIANIGSARVEATGEAMEDGRAGQVIRVRNVESNRVVRGRVETSGVIVAEY
jgi:flagella basal body P-ring formation protein FlgA